MYLTDYELNREIYKEIALLLTEDASISTIHPNLVLIPSVIPDWSTDTNLALNLVKDMYPKDGDGLYFSLSTNSLLYPCWCASIIQYEQYAIKGSWVINNNFPARAISEVWWSYRCSLKE